MENHEKNVNENEEIDVETGIDTEPLVDEAPTVESTSLTKNEERIDDAELGVKNIESINDERRVDATDVELLEKSEDHGEIETDESSETQPIKQESGVDKYSAVVDDTLENAKIELDETEKSENNSVVDIVEGKHDQESDDEEKNLEVDEVG